MMAATIPAGPHPARVEFRAMTREDIPAGLAFCRASGWNQLAEDWEQLLARGGDRCRVAVLGERVVGTATTVEYDGRFAWIGMVLVDAEVRGRGIGSALLRRAIESLGAVPARLDATRQGYPLYLALGFAEESRLRRMTSAAAVPRTRRGGGTVRPMRHADLDAVMPWDGEVFGADRRLLLGWALDTAPELAWVAERDGSLHGFCLGRHGHQFSQIGPVVACDVETAFSVVEACRARVPDTPMVIDVPASPRPWSERLADLGFVEQRPFIRMCRGANRYAGRPEAQWAIFGPEWG